MAASIRNENDPNYEDLPVPKGFRQYTQIKTEDRSEDEENDFSTDDFEYVRQTLETKIEFNRRKITISKFPEDRVQEILQLLKVYPTIDVKLTSDPIVALATFENIREATIAVNDLSEQFVAEQSLDVSMVARDKLLCLAQLPLDCQKDQLADLFSSNGYSGNFFLMLSEQTGRSKGYCFVEFKDNIEELLELRSKLDWVEYEGHRLHCDVVDTKLIEYEQLHSRCLLIDNLPKDFTEVTKLREISSCYVKPLYCQIAMTNGISLEYGIIEYRTPEEAELSQQELIKQCVNDIPLRVTYCIPGKSAVVICSRLIGSQLDANLASKSSLLPDPVYPRPSLVRNKIVEALCHELPNLMQTFQTSLNELQQAYVDYLTTVDSKPGLLGVAPTMSASPLMNPNLQLGLVILLALQMQSTSPQQILESLNMLSALGAQKDREQDGVPSSSIDPLTAQANIILQNLMGILKMRYTRTNAKPTLLFTLAKIISNLNLNWLINVGHIVNYMPQSNESADSEPAKPQPLMSLTAQPAGGRGLLGKSPMPLMGSTSLLSQSSRPGILGNCPFDSNESDFQSSPRHFENLDSREARNFHDGCRTVEGILRDVFEFSSSLHDSELEGYTADVNLNINSQQRADNLNEETSLLGCPPPLLNFVSANKPQNMNDGASLLGTLPGLMDGCTQFYNSVSRKWPQGGDMPRKCLDGMPTYENWHHSEQEEYTADVNLDLNSSQQRADNFNKQTSLLGYPPSLLNFESANKPKNLNDGTSLLGTPPGLMDGCTQSYNPMSRKWPQGGDMPKKGVGGMSSLQENWRHSEQEEYTADVNPNTNSSHRNGDSLNKQTSLLGYPPPLLNFGSTNKPQNMNDGASLLGTPPGLMDGCTQSYNPMSRKWPQGGDMPEKGVGGMSSLQENWRHSEQEEYTADVKFNRNSSQQRADNLSKPTSLLGYPPLLNFGSANKPQNMNDGTSLLGTPPGLMDGCTQSYNPMSRKWPQGGDMPEKGVGGMSSLQENWGCETSRHYEGSYFDNQCNENYGSYRGCTGAAGNYLPTKLHSLNKEPDYKSMAADAMTYAATSNQEYNKQSRLMYTREYHHGCDVPDTYSQQQQRQRQSYRDNDDTYQEDNHQFSDYQDYTSRPEAEFQSPSTTP